MNKTSVICKLHEITDHYLLGAGTWPADRERLPALYQTFRNLGLDEDVPDSPGTTRSTALGKELKLDLLMAFVGALDLWDIPHTLEAYGYIDESQAEELCFGPVVKMERKLRCYVFQAYLKFLNHSELRH
ncbi:hypothetical protein [Bradyrhizobium liaoningense]|uniref:hypothetical protein n=1 Tax=Bradyrhizobium liaoningense TaxID=43992 RepID=UPI001BAA67CC|nr:hypothetical protein [Bradyrhizobium liaoningense]MBR0941568.1 hypothetical protein [Bradyrhizobium liaoningense]